MNTETMWTVVGVWLIGLFLLVAYLVGRAWWARHQTRQAWKRTPILGPVRVNVRRVL